MKALLTALLIVSAVWATAVPSHAAQRADDEAAIRKSVESYVEAFNRGDAAGVAGHWSEDGEYIGAAGESLKGRKKIEAAFKTFFAENQGLQIKAVLISIRFPSPSRAVETGLATITRAGQHPKETRYVATHVKRAGVWRLASVRDEEGSVILPGYDHLKDLEWLIGEWGDADKESAVDTTFRWTRNRSFIASSFIISVHGSTSLQGSQVIGWDPVTKTIRSWMFDSEGGFGEGVWSKQGNQWLVKSSSVLSTGEKASSINVYTYVDANTFTWQSIGRELGGEPQPNIEAVTVVRKQPGKSQSGKRN